MPRSTALAGLRVLDLTNLFAAPQVAATLADFGADVVKVEPPEGDPLRRIGARRGGESVAWAWVARNKRSIALDLDDRSDRALFARLVEQADVLVENLPRSLRARWGCDETTLRARNPRLVVTSISAFGRTGPRADQPGAGTLAEAFAGFAHLNGEAEGPPGVPSLPLGDTLVGLSGVIGTLLALFARDRSSGGTGLGQHVDVSMFEPVLQLMALPLASWAPGTPPPRRSGSRVAGGVPRNLYRAADGDYLALSGTTDAQVERILSLLGRTTEQDRVRFGTSNARLAAADELDGLVADWIAARPRPEALAAFEAIRIPVAPVNDLAALLEDPQVRARAAVTTLEDPLCGSLAFVSPVPTLEATPGRLRHTGPALDADRVGVLRDWLSGAD